MKAIFIPCLLCLILASALVANPVSDEQFKKMDIEGREKVILEAPPDRQSELKRIDFHLQLVSELGGETGLKSARERGAAKERGFHDMENLFVTQMRIWDSYVAGAERRMVDATGTIPRNHASEVKAMEQKQDDFRSKYLPMVHLLVFNLTPTPAALSLEMEIEALDVRWEEQFNLTGTHAEAPPITKEQMTEVDKECDRILKEIKKLPKLTPAQAKKEYDEFTEDKVRE